MAKAQPDQAKPESFRLGDSTSHLLRRAELMAGERFAKLAGENLTLRQFAVLTAVAADPGLKQADLVRATGIDRSTLADMLNRMQRSGLLLRTASKADARAHAITLTAIGAERFADAVPHARAADEFVLDNLPRTKAKALHSILLKLAAKADEAAERAARKAKRQAKREQKARRKAKAKPRRARA